MFAYLTIDQVKVYCWVFPNQSRDYSFRLIGSSNFANKDYLISLKKVNSLGPFNNSLYEEHCSKLVLYLDIVFLFHYIHLSTMHLLYIYYYIVDIFGYLNAIIPIYIYRYGHRYGIKEKACTFANLGHKYGYNGIYLIINF